MAGAKNRVYWAAFIAFVIAGVGLFLVPAFIIRPFKYQSPTALHIALVFRQFAAAGTILAACAVLALMWVLWVARGASNEPQWWPEYWCWGRRRWRA